MSNGFAPIPRHAHTDYTTRYRCTYADDDYAIHTHGNGICVLTLAPTHPLRRLNKTITSVAWQGVSARALQAHDRSKAKVSGKRKKGGQYLEPNSVLGQVECSDGTFYDLRATVHGKLVEVNESLGRRAQMMVSHAAWEGFLALFMLSPRCKAMLSVEDRRVEGSEAERDHAESTPLAPEASDAVVAERNAQAAADAATNLAAQELAQKEGRAWQSVLEYLTPAQYLDKRKAFFQLPTSDAPDTSTAASTSTSAPADSASAAAV